MTSIAVDASGGVHYAFPFFATPIYSERTTSGWHFEGNPDPSTFDAQGSLDATTQGVTIAAGTRSGAPVTYLVYTVVGLPAPAPDPLTRLGVKSGGVWTFEDVPADVSGTLATDPSGAALLLGSRILRRTGTAKWEVLDTTPAALTSITGGATDDDGTIYVIGTSNAAQNDVAVARRGSDGSWAAEQLTAHGVAGRIRAGAHTVHVTYAESGKGALYARRIGGGWSRHVWTTAQFNEAAMVVDTCGRPHFITLQENSAAPPSFVDVYTRWTAEGFRSISIPAYADGNGLDIAVTPAAAVFSYYDGAYVLGSVPL